MSAIGDPESEVHSVKDENELHETANPSDDLLPSSLFVADKDKLLSEPSSAVQAYVDQTRAVRRRVQTEKGRAYQIQILEKKSKEVYKNIERHCTLILGQLTGDNTDIVNREATNREVFNLDKLKAEQDEVLDRYLPLLLEDEQGQLNERHAMIDNHIFETRSKASEWLRLERTDDARSVSSRASSRAHSRHSQQSNRSNKSHSSVKSHASSKSNASLKSNASRKSNRSVKSNASARSENEIKIAGLLAEEEAVKKAIDAELEQLECMKRLKQASKEVQLTRIQEKLVKAKTLDEVLSQRGRDVRSEVDANEDKKDTVNSLSQHKRRDTSHTADVAGWLAQTSIKTKKKDQSMANVSDSNSESSLLADAMIKLAGLHSAPRVDLDIFMGDPLEYRYFRTTFTDVVERNVKDQRGRLNRLLKYTDGEAKDLIKHCIDEDNDVCFDKDIELFESWYGNPHLVARSYIKELRQWPSIPSNNASALKKLHRFLLKGLTHLRDGRLNELGSDSIIRGILGKIGTSAQEQWLKQVVRARQRKGKEKGFEDLVSYVEYLCLLASDPSYSQDVFREDKEMNTCLKSFATQVQFAKCPLCNGTHSLDECLRFIDMTVEERIKLIFHQKLCLTCFDKISDDHVAKTCKKKQICKICKDKHPTTLHGHNCKTLKSLSVYQAGESVQQNISMSIVPVRISHQNNPLLEMIVYALLDENSQGVFAKDSVLDDLKVNKRQTCITTESINGREFDLANAVDGLIVKPMPEIEQVYGSAAILLPTGYSRETLPLHGREIPTKEKVKEWKHLERILEHLPKYDASIPLGLIIGANCPKALQPEEIIRSSEGGPYASRSLLGWRVIGPISGTTDAITCCKIGVIPMKDISTDLIAEHHLTVASPVKDESVANFLKEMYDADFVEEHSERQGLSIEDRQFLELMSSSVTKVDGHYQLPLPFKNPAVTMPDNKLQAMSRLDSVKKKMLNNEDYCKEYTEFINTLLEKGYAKESGDSEPGKSWYIPHHGVYHKVKKKIRVVFDCSATYRGSCLNEELLQGPDLTNLLLGVLIRFRREKVAFMADIEAMFHQVRVPPEQQSFLKFMWWPNGDTSQLSRVYQMCVHIFGAISSPSSANFALRQTATDNIECGLKAADSLLNNFYVDDCLRSESDAETAISTIASTERMCTEGGFNLTKFVCTDKRVVESIPREKQSPITTYELSKTMTTERALGVHWCIETDTLGFRIIMKDTPLTRRGILSTISSVYDPIGFAGPYLLKGKRILQQITALNDGWNTAVPTDLASSWTVWRTELPRLEEVTIQRCFKPSKFGDVIKTQLHSFSDACEYGYGVGSYLRQVDCDGQIHVSPVVGKSRVAPLKSITIPRLELTSGTLSAKVGCMVKEELQMPNVEEFFWMDSKVALGYIHNDVRRFRVFVANRVQKIRTRTNKDRWFYVDTKQNPADLASRGLTVDDQEGGRLWLKGPVFLWKREELWPLNEGIPLVSDNDPEVNKVVMVHATTVNDSFSILQRFEDRRLSWRQAGRVMAVVIKFCKLLRKQDTTVPEVVISVADVQIAETALLKLIQQRELNNEIQFYIKQNTVSPEQKRTNNQRRSESRLWSLDPFVDEEGILRVGGRLRKSVSREEGKHPIILPKMSPMVQRIIEHCHSLVKHGGRTSTVNALRQEGFWVVNASTRVRSVIQHCLHCRIMRGRLGEQKMADLPSDRSISEGPF